MPQGFTTSLDIAKRTAIHLGSTIPATLADDKKFVTVFNVLYDKARRAELRRHGWTFATRRTILRSITTTSQTFVPAAYVAGAAYDAGDIVYDANVDYWVNILACTGVTPGDNLNWLAYTGPLLTDNWSSAIQYYNGDLVTNSSVVYIAVNANLNSTPPSANWLDCDSSIGTVNSAITLAPNVYQRDFKVRSIYPLPNRYLRLAPQDPKTRSNPRLGVSNEMRYRDWEIENGYLVTMDTAPILFRFVADHTNVPLMLDLFCEALAARIAMEACETITQSKEKIDTISGMYTGFIRQAHEQNAIEFASTEDPENPEQAAQPAPEKAPAR